MNIGQIKVICWGGAGVLAAGLALYVGFFVRDLDNRRKPPDPTKIVHDLESVESVKAKTADLVPYEDVRRLYLLAATSAATTRTQAPELDRQAAASAVGARREGRAHHGPGRQDGRAREDPVLPGRPLGQEAEPRLAQVPAKAAVQNTAAGGGFWLKEGDHLATPHEYARIDKIDSQAVRFAFDDANREPEPISPDEFDSRTTIVQVDQDGVIRAKLGGIPKSDVKPWQPTHTTAFGTNRYMLGTEDMLYANENYPKILSDEVRTGRHQDPRTGKYDGIEIDSVTPNSFADRHGAQEGDVVKSINGHPVTSVQEAISYAKMNANQFTTWEIVIERNGKLQTFYYQSPQQ
jgi:hypothetical protein